MQAVLLEALSATNLLLKLYPVVNDAGELALADPFDRLLITRIDFRDEVQTGILRRHRQAVVHA